MNTDIVKTLNYIKKNGPVKTYYAIRERLRDKKNDDYTYTPICEEERLDQIQASLSMDVRISILVPAYETPEKYLRELIDSVITQTYGKWELVIADAGTSDKVSGVVASYQDERIVYVRLDQNKGISGNTNEGLKHCTGDYIGLLDHDDLLTNDALYEMASRITRERKDGIKTQMLFSNEDKTDSDKSRFFEVNIKPKFNLDLLLSNNYICHFLVVEASLARKILLRREYDGAQDHDFILRCVSALQREYGSSYEKYISHIDRVLYHWRCHEASTAANPKSKEYAYEAGRRAVEDYLKSSGINAVVTHSEHVGFFKIKYEPDIFSQRKDVCALGCRVLDKKGRVKDGVYDEDGNVMFLGLDSHDSGGYLHRASCSMEVPCISVLGMIPGKEASAVFNELLGRQKTGTEIDYKKLSMEFCKIMKDRGYRFLYDPDTVVKGK
ncbi:MAG: glycosyltransferase [Lachnospiraceae bacterium]|nr:glycosyltransferase [Lachnospiraceae bacterium]